METILLQPNCGSNIKLVPVGEVLNDQVVIRNPSNDQIWTVSIIGNTVSYKPTAIAMVPDRSESMSEEVGDYPKQI